MIDLSHTRAGFLAQIHAPDPLGDPLSDLTDRRVATADAHLRISGRAPEQLFSLLKAVLLERFGTVARREWIRDLLVPLKNALGNACKHGNGADPAKVISIEMVLTGKGVLIAVTDQGKGFDAALAVQRFQGQENYFENRGEGFRNLHRAMARVSYENAGRTVLLCFQPATEVQGESPGGGRALPKLLDGEWVQNRLSTERPEFSNDRARIESCRAYAPHECADDDCGNRYVLRVASHDGRLVETRILTGRLHATRSAAEADFEAATRLHHASFSSRVLIPRPVALLAGKPSLALYDFDPWMNLWEYFTDRGRLKTLRRTAKRIARALARLHRSQVVFPHADPECAGGGVRELAVRTEKYLQTLPCGPDLVNHFREAAQRIELRAEFGGRQILAPIHGALGWNCIHYGVDGRFYLYRFEACRQSDPGLDLGGFTADLLRFTSANHDEAAYPICLEDFLGKYNSEATHPLSKDDLLPYTVIALVERLERADPFTKADAGQLLGALDAALTARPRGAESEVPA